MAAHDTILNGRPGRGAGLPDVQLRRVFAEKISTRLAQRPELERAVGLAREVHTSGVAVTLVVHEHKRLGRGIELVTLAERLRTLEVGLEFLTGELRGSHINGYSIVLV